MSSETREKLESQLSQSLTTSQLKDMIRLYHSRLEELVAYTQGKITQERENFERERLALEAKHKEELGEAQPQNVHEQVLSLKAITEGFKEKNVLLSRRVKDLEAKIDEKSLENSAMKKELESVREELNKLKTGEQSTASSPEMQRAEKPEKRKIKKHATVQKGDDTAAKLAIEKVQKDELGSDDKKPTEKTTKRAYKTSRTISAEETKRVKVRPKSQTIEPAPREFLDDNSSEKTTKRASGATRSREERQEDTPEKQNINDRDFSGEKLTKAGRVKKHAARKSMDAAVMFTSSDTHSKTRTTNRVNSTDNEEFKRSKGSDDPEDGATNNNNDSNNDNINNNSNNTGNKSNQNLLSSNSVPLQRQPKRLKPIQPQQQSVQQSVQNSVQNPVQQQKQINGENDGLDGYPQST